MNESLNNMPQSVRESSPIENSIGSISQAINRLEESIGLTVLKVRGLDEVANKLNPDVFYKNVKGEDNSKTFVGPGIPTNHSGLQRDLFELSFRLNNLIDSLDNFANSELSATVNFFHNQI